MNVAIRFVLGIVFALLVAAPSSAVEFPSDSIYRLPVSLTDQNGRTSNLADRHGTPQLVSMFYTSCQYMCPLIIDTLKKTQSSLPPDIRARLPVLLISFDPDRDTVARLHEVFEQRHLDPDTWTLARTDEANVRKLAAVFDIQYRKLENREINHTSALILLDGDGRIVAHTDKIGEVDSDFTAHVQAEVQRGMK